jgi:cysteine dioxygenase
VGGAACTHTDTIGLHRVENVSHTEGAVSLHLYTPAYSECRTFHEASGQARSSGRMTFYTVNGERVTCMATPPQ